MGTFSGSKKEERNSAPPKVQGKPDPDPRAAAARATPPDGAAPRVGIDHAIQLMRVLPMKQNVDLVVQVVKKTFEALNIRVSDIVQDANRRQQEIQTRVTQLKTEIGTLEREVEIRIHEIRRLEAAHEETKRVRDQLERAREKAD